MKDYSQELAKLSDSQKTELWNEVKDMSFSNKTRFAMIYYKAKKLKYL